MIVLNFLGTCAILSGISFALIKIFKIDKSKVLTDYYEILLPMALVLLSFYFGSPSVLNGAHPVLLFLAVALVSIGTHMIPVGAKYIADHVRVPWR